MPITTKKAPSTLPDKAKSIYVAAWNAAYGSTCKDKGEERDACASKIAWSAVKNKYEKSGETWVAKKSEYEPAVVDFSMFIDKAVYSKESQELRWHCVASDTEEDSYSDNMTEELFRSFLERIESNERPPEKYCSEFWKGGKPYISVSHYSDQDGKGVPGDVECVYIDGEKFKGKGTFYQNKLGWACFNAINRDKFGTYKAKDKELNNPVRISIAFLDYKHRHKSNGEIFVRENLDDQCPYCLLEALTGKSEGKEYLDGHLIHLALTRIPVNKRTEMEVSRSMATRKGDAESIVGEIAEELEEQETQFRSEALVTMSEEEIVEEAKHKDEDMEDDEEEMSEDEKKKKMAKEEKSETRHILQDVLDAYKSAFDKLGNAEATAEEKLRAMQTPLEQLAQVTRAHLEGTTVEKVQENEQIAQLKSQLENTNSEVAQLRQDLQIALQALQDKSNVQETQVPAVRSLQPQQVTRPVLPAQGQPRGLHEIIQRSVGA